MRKFTLCILTAVFFLTGCTQTERPRLKENDRIPDLMAGNHIPSKVLFYNGSEIDYEVVYVCDKDGNIVEEQNGDEVCRMVYENGNRISRDCGEYKSIYSYNDQGQMIRSEIYSGNQWISSYEYQLDASGNHIGNVFTSEEGLRIESVMSYNEKNQLLEVNTEEHKAVYEYNDQGELVKITNYVGENVESTTVFTYENGLRVSRQDSLAEGTKVYERYVYNDENDLIEVYTGYNSEENSVKTREYIYN